MIPLYNKSPMSDVKLEMQKFENPDRGPFDPLASLRAQRRNIPPPDENPIFSISLFTLGGLVQARRFPQVLRMSNPRHAV